MLRMPVMNERDLLHSPAVVWGRVVLRMTLFALALLWPAGRVFWWEAWVMVGLWTLFAFDATRYLLHHDPALLEERLQLLPWAREQKTWDKVIMMLLVIIGLPLYILPGLDVVRYGWSEPLPSWIRISALLLQALCLAGIGRVMRENTYLAQVVKIDRERNQHVVTTGPYALVRHPMYSMIILLVFAVPASLGSRCALLLSVFLAVLLVLRTRLEDRTLHDELDGYAAYAQRTRYRLFPGVW